MARRLGPGARRWLLVGLWLVASVGTAAASPDASRLVLAGIRRIGQEQQYVGPEGVAEAKSLFLVVQRALEFRVGKPIVGAAELANLLGPGFLDRLLGCSGDRRCIRRMLVPLRAVGPTTAVTVDYTVAASVYHFRVVVFRLNQEEDAQGDTEEFVFDLDRVEVLDPAYWRERVAGIIALQSKLNATETGGAKAPAPADPLEPPPGAPAPAPTIGLVGREASLRAVRVADPPTIDGKLDDLSWQRATVADHFTQRFPDEATLPSQRTQLRVLYDDEALYVSVRCFDTTPGAIVAQLTRRDRDVNVDRVAIDISSKNDRSSAYHFQVNAAGVQLDGLRFNDTDYNNNWDGRWYAATSIDDRGWIAELKIPLVTLRYGADVSAFGFQVRRYVARRGEVAEWAYIPSTSRGEVSYYGSLTGLDGLRARRLFEVLVYDARRWMFRSGQGAFDGRSDGGGIGADLKLGLTSALTLDASINPDFGTVEVDQVVLNLTTLENFFPEKRPFFIEGADLFATPFTLFYSRRVGATPPAPAVGSLVEPLPAGRIHAALKMSGVLTGRLSIAVLDAVTARRDAVIERTPGEVDTLLVEPTSNFGVVRLRQDFGTNSFIGAMVTAVNRLEPADAAAPTPGDVCPVPYSTAFISLLSPPPRNGRCTNDAYAGGLDATVRTADGEWGVTGQVVGSRVAEGPTRFIPDGTSIGAGASGIGTSLEAGRYGGEHWLFKLWLRSASPRFQINDVGYQDQANFHQGIATVTLRTTKPHGPFQSAAVSFEANHRRTWDNQWLTLDPFVTLAVQLKNLWSVTLQAEAYPKWYENRETQDGALTERNHGFYGLASIQTDPNKAFVLSAQGSMFKNLGGLASGRFATTLSMRPVSTLELDLIANMSLELGGPRWIETADNGDGSRTYYFSELDVKAVDVTLRGTYTFTPKLSLQAYLQPFVASGRYARVTAATASGARPTLALASFAPATAPGGAPTGFQAGALNVNVFLRYEYLPLSALWLVYTRDQQQAPFDAANGAPRLRLDQFANGATTDVFMLKLSYLWY